MNDSIPVGVFEEAEDDGYNKSIEKKVGDRYPILKRCPVVSEDYPDVLDADAEGDQHPQDQEAFVLLFCSKYQHQGTDNTSETIQNSVLD